MQTTITRYPRIRSLVVPALLAAALLLMPGCGRQAVRLNVEAVQNLSPGPAGDPHPVMLKLYLLAQKENFETGDYQALWNDPKNLLGGDLLGNPIPIDVAPGDTIVDRRIPKTKEALYLGVVAGYHNPTEDGWRKVFAFHKKHRKPRVLIHLLENEMEVRYEKYW